MKVNFQRIAGLAIAVPIMAVTFAPLWIWTEQRQVTEEIRALQESHFVEFLEDQKAASTVHEVLSGTQHRDAGPYLAQRLAWEGMPDYSPRGVPSITISEQLSDAIIGLGTDWPGADAALAGHPLDLSWMRDLLQFDYWDPFATQQFRNWYTEQTKPSWIEAPIPNMVTLVRLSKARLIGGIAADEANAAFEEVRHLAKLAYSTETLLGAVIAVHLLQYEREAHDYMMENGFVAPAWDPIDEATLDRAQRAAFAFVSYAGVITEPETLKQTLDPSRNRFGRCAAISEGAMRGKLTRDWLGASSLGAPDFRSGYRFLEDIVSGDERCRLTSVEVQRSLGKSDYESFDPVLNNGVVRLLEVMPGFRRYQLIVLERELAESVFSEDDA